MPNLLRVTLISFLTLIGASVALPTPITFDLSSVANGSWCAVGGGPMVNCTSLPTGNLVSYGGQTFDIAGANGGNNAWFSSAAANNGPSAVSVTIPVNQANVVSVYTLMNTFWGQSGNPQTGEGSYDSITFTGSLGDVYTVNLFGDSDIRDYNNYIWTNSINGTTTINAWTNGSQRLDEQIFALPSAFASETLTSITITDIGNDTFSRLFLAGLTVDTASDPVPNDVTPEPASVLLTAAGLIGVGIFGARRKRR